MDLADYQKEIGRLRRSVALLWIFAIVVLGRWALAKVEDVLPINGHPGVARSADTFTIFTYDNRDPSVIPEFLVVQDGPILRSAHLPLLPLKVESGKWDIDATKLKWLDQDGHEAEPPTPSEEVRLVYTNGAWSAKR